MSAGRRRRFRRRPRRRGAGSRPRATRKIRWLVEATFRTGTQSHACLEPHAAVARFDGDSLTVHVSTQAVFHLMELIAKRYKLGHDKVRVIADHVGGGFGSKASLGMETIAAIELAREAKAPVRIAYDRHEELSVTGYRPAAEIKIALLPSRAGRSQGAVAHRLCRHRGRDQLDARRAGAADLSGGSQGARRFRRHQQSAARRAVPRSRRAADGVRAGTGDRRSRVADEGRSDRACASAGIPIRTASGSMTGPPASTCGATARTAAPQTGRYRRGVGVATGYWLYLWQPGVKVELAVESGRLVASTATQDIGQGSRTVIANTVAHEFGLEPHDVEVRIGNSDLPEGSGAGGSRTTASVIPPTLLAVQKLKDAIEQNAKRKPVPGSNAPWREMIAASPDLSVASVRPEDSKPTAAGRALAAEGGRLHRHDLRLDDAALFQSRGRRRRAEFGAGDRGGSRHLARPCARAQCPYRHRGRQDRGPRAGAQPGDGLGDPGPRLCAL